MSTASGDIMSGSKQIEVNQKSSPISCKRKEQSASSRGKENLQNLTSATYTDDEDSAKVVDKLIKPNASCPKSADGASSEEVKYLKKAVVLLLEQTPISEPESMITIANGFFKCFNRLSIDYSSFYENVKNYIWYSASLASTEQFKNSSSLEDLAAQYSSEKLCYERARKTYWEISGPVVELKEHNQLLRDRISASEESKKQCRPEHGRLLESKLLSGCRNRLEVELEESEGTLRSALEAQDEFKKKWNFHEAWQDFISAKTDLGL